MRVKRLLGIFLLAAMTLGGCGEKPAEGNVVELQESALTAPQKTEVVRGDMEVVMYYDAQVGPKVEQLTFAEPGSFGEFHVQLGDTVKKGQLLASPVLEQVEAAIEASEEQLEMLDTNYNYQKVSMENSIAIIDRQMEELYEKLDNLTYPSPEYTNTCFQLGSYDEQRKRTELQMKHRKEVYDLERPRCVKQLNELKAERDGNLIVAPFDGTVVALADVEYGSYLNTNTYYVAVADSSTLYARCPNISITILNKLEKITFWKDAKEYDAVAIPMDHAYYMATKNNGEDAYSEFEIIAPDGDVAYGDYGKLKFIAKTKKDVLMIPETTVRLSGGVYYAYKDVDGKQERVELTIGDKNDLYVEVLEGLEEGDVVYVQD